MKFRKKSVVIEAIQNVGGNGSEIVVWANNPNVTFQIHGHHDVIIIRTLEGFMTGAPNDWIIKGVAGEFYPCKDFIFKETYEAVE